MPIFEYRCAECGHEFEQIVFRQTETIRCPKCDSVQTEKLLSSFAVCSPSSSTRSASGAGAGGINC